MYMNLKAEMARKGITNEQLANGIGINPATMSAKLNIAGRMDELGFSTERLLRLKEEALANYRQVNEEGHADGLDVAMEHLRRCAQAALKEDIVVENQPDEDRARQSERDYEEQKRAFLKRAVMQQLGRKAGKGSLWVLSEKKLEEKAAAAMAQLKENTWEKRISTP